MVEIVIKLMIGLPPIVCSTIMVVKTYAELFKRREEIELFRRVSEERNRKMTLIGFSETVAVDEIKIKRDYAKEQAYEAGIREDRGI